MCEAWCPRPASGKNVGYCRSSKSQYYHQNNDFRRFLERQPSQPVDFAQNMVWSYFSCVKLSNSLKIFPFFTGKIHNLRSQLTTVAAILSYFSSTGWRLAFLKISDSGQHRESEQDATVQRWWSRRQRAPELSYWFATRWVLRFRCHRRHFSTRVWRVPRPVSERPIHLFVVSALWKLYLPCLIVRCNRC